MEGGYRWVLTYNLVNTSSAVPQSAAGLDAQIARFCSKLAEWRSMDTGPMFLCYPFRYQYPDQDFKLTSLKSNDYNRARYVVDSCEKRGDFCVLLANLIGVKTFANGKEGWEEDSEGGDANFSFELTLEHIVHIGGFRLCESLSISANHLLRDWIYDPELRQPDEQSGGGSMAYIEQVYKDKVCSEVKYKILCSTHCLHRLWLLFLDLPQRHFYSEPSLPSSISPTFCNVFKNFSRCEIGTHLPTNSLFRLARTI